MCCMIYPLSLDIFRMLWFTIIPAQGLSDDVSVSNKITLHLLFDQEAPLLKFPWNSNNIKIHTNNELCIILMWITVKKLNTYRKIIEKVWHFHTVDAALKKRTGVIFTMDFCIHTLDFIYTYIFKLHYICVHVYISIFWK